MIKPLLFWTRWKIGDKVNVYLVSSLTVINAIPCFYGVPDGTKSVERTLHRCDQGWSCKWNNHWIPIRVDPFGKFYIVTSAQSIKKKETK